MWYLKRTKKDGMIWIYKNYYLHIYDISGVKFWFFESIVILLTNLE